MYNNTYAFNGQLIVNDDTRHADEENIYLNVVDAPLYLHEYATELHNPGLPSGYDNSERFQFYIEGGDTTYIMAPAFTSNNQGNYFEQGGMQRDIPQDNSGYHGYHEYVDSEGSFYQR